MKFPFDQIFEFSRAQKRAILVLMSILLVLLVIPMLKQHISKSATVVVYDFSEDETADANDSGQNKVLNINRATLSDCMAIGFSATQANDILAYKASNGPFKRKIDVLELGSISKEQFLEVYDFFTVGGWGSTTKPVNKRKRLNVAININTASAEEFERLPGIGPILSKRIVKYRSAIGGFKHHDDLLKVYGIEPAVYDAFQIHLSPLTEAKPEKSEEEDAFISYDEKENAEDTLLKAESVSKWDINMATANQFESISGIGPVLSKRIVKFRDVLGGFSTPNQLYDVYGLEQEVVVALLKEGVIGSGRIRRLDLNVSTYQELISHPYIEKLQAEYIIKQRRIIPFEKVQDLSSSYLFKEEKLKRLEPYLMVN